MIRGDRVLVGKGRRVHRAAYDGINLTCCGFLADAIAPDGTRKQPCKVCERAWQKAQL